MNRPKLNRIKVSEKFIVEEVNGMGDAIVLLCSNDVERNDNTLSVSTAFFNLNLGQSVILEIINMMIGSYYTFENEELFAIDGSCCNWILLQSPVHNRLPVVICEICVVTAK